MSDIATKPEPKPAETKKSHRLRALAQKHWKWLTLVAVLVIGGGGAYAWTVLRAQPQPTAVTVNKTKPTATPTPTTKLSSLTGLPVSPELAERPITSVIIENHPDARPQSGLSQAGVVYEALAEGGITRFQAFFLDQRPAAVGPVRSIRTYFVDWGLEFNAPVAHAGGNVDALDLIGPLHLKNIDGLYSGPSQYFYRTADRVAPHNLYTSSDLLDKALTAYGFNQPADFPVSPRKADTPTSSPAHPKIHIDFSYNGYQVDYSYVTASNDYARNLAGAPHIDRNTGQQIHVKNVVVEYMPTSYGTTRLGEQTVIMQTVGQGKALVFRDGGVVEGTWSKASHSARTQLTDASGKVIPLDAGNTWYEVIPTGNNVSY